MKNIDNLRRELEKLPSKDKPFAYEALGEVQEECDKMREALSRLADSVELSRGRGQDVGHQSSLGSGCACIPCRLKLAREALKEEATDEN